MKIASFRLRGIRCFEDTGDVSLAPGCNVFVGQNNAGKSTLLKAAMAWQGFPFANPNDFRSGNVNVENDLLLTDIKVSDFLRVRAAQADTQRFTRIHQGTGTSRSDHPSVTVGDDQAIFNTSWPNNTIVPFIAKRKAVEFSQGVSRGSQESITGTFSNLYMPELMSLRLRAGRHTRFLSKPS